MALSERTKTAIPGGYVTEDPIASFCYDSGATPVYRLSDDERDGASNTADDMSNLFMWMPGDIVRGTKARSIVAMSEYIKDIQESEGKQKRYEHSVIYIDTLNNKKLVSEQLKDFLK